MIKDISTKDLELYCVDLISKTIVELGQTKTDKDIVLLAQSLALDLKEDFSKLLFEDIVQAFRIGVRQTDDFHLNVKCYYRWIKAHKQLIHEQSYIEEQFRDKKLKYRINLSTKKQLTNEQNYLKQS